MKEYEIEKMPKLKEIHLLDINKLFSFCGFSDDTKEEEAKAVNTWNQYISSIIGATLPIDAGKNLILKQSKLYKLAVSINENLHCTYEFCFKDKQADEQVLILMGLILDHCCYTKVVPVIRRNKTKT